jgi:hypothetical protein
METKGRDDRLKKATVSQKSDDQEHERFWLMQTVERGRGSLALKVRRHLLHRERRSFWLGITMCPSPWRA